MKKQPICLGAETPENGKCKKTITPVPSG